MLQSMTGFGKTTIELPNQIINIEIKSLNSKQLDVSLKIPNLYKEKDIEFRKKLAEHLIRGKIEVFFFVDITGDKNKMQINKEIVKNYFFQLKEIGKELGIPPFEELLTAVLKFPDALKMENTELSKNEWSKILISFEEAINELKKFRLQEGLVLEKDIVNRINKIKELLADIPQYEEGRIKIIKDRITQHLETFLSRDKIDENRFEQELIFYIEKFDITEEKVRLENHCLYFLETIEKNKSAIGKKLAFIAQEIGREINTIGSKANDLNIQKIVVEMKDELEKVKEQMMNIL